MFRIQQRSSFWGKRNQLTHGAAPLAAQQRNRSRRLSAEALEPRHLLSGVPFSAGLTPYPTLDPSLTGAPREVILADLDGDGDQDVLTGAFTEDGSINDGQVVWYEIDGSGAFSDFQILADDLPRVNSLAVGDVTGDGIADVVVGTNESVLVIQQSAVGVFEAATELISYEDGPARTSSIVIEKVDGDDLYDVVVGWEFEHSVMWYKNKPDDPGKFDSDSGQSVATSVLGERPLDIVTADVDGDGDMDIVVAEGFSDSVLLFENLGINRGVFVLKQVINVEAEVDNARGVAVGDINSDGAIDIVVVAHGSDTVTWYENAPGNLGTFSDSKTIFDGIGPEIRGPMKVFVGDVNGDMTQDVLVVSAEGGDVTLFTNDGTGVFAEPQALSKSASDGRAITAGDIDQDGDLDVFVAAVGLDQFLWFRNGLVHDTPADFTLDALVNEDDYTVWSENHGLRGEARITDGDADGDGDVDGSDFLMWQANFVPTPVTPGGGVASASVNGEATAVSTGDERLDDDSANDIPGADSAGDAVEDLVEAATTTDPSSTDVPVVVDESGDEDEARIGDDDAIRDRPIYHHGSILEVAPFVVDEVQAVVAETSEVNPAAKTPEPTVVDEAMVELGARAGELSESGSRRRLANADRANLASDFTIRVASEQSRRLIEMSVAGFVQHEHVQDAAGAVDLAIEEFVDETAAGLRARISSAEQLPDRFMTSRSRLAEEPSEDAAPGSSSRLSAQEALELPTRRANLSRV